MTLKEPDQATKPDPVRADAVSAASQDRRRSGRSDHVNPNLVPLLRGHAVTEDAPASGTESGTAEDPADDDALAPAQGIAIGLALSVPIWAVIGWIIWAVL